MSSWEKAFDAFTWKNKSESTETPLDASHLNRINTAVNTIDDRVITLQGDLDDAVKLVDGQPLFKYYQQTIGTIGPSASAPVGNWQRLIIAKPVIPGYTIFTASISDYIGSGSTSLMMELVFSLSDSSSYLIFEANKTIQGVKVTYVAVRSDLISAVS